MRVARGRPREFDTDAAIERAMGVFWSSGYHGTSLPDLLEATNLSRGSLYAAFGDKHGLFLLALDRYIDDALTRLDSELDPRKNASKNASKNALASLRACLAGYVERAGGASGKRGCLVVATAMELASHDIEVEQRIRRFFKAMETRLTAALTRVQAEGDLVDGVEPATVARLLVCLIEGMRVVNKTSPDRSLSQAVVQILIDRFAR
ncbi:TetR/AcrR family transcriptional regulator [Bradyrhizobium prioriisuperbiae]|uniref:TetR/AcrR family transcriptional regulator n=1 Tax=Bradyrhizobium prioriisuperbiae TaxID=2854389 RepID=UPI0028EAB60E|nr:TetR/AcrR family transcriptional regulator [Bradyrhizobium prioritasuperba]